MDRGALSWSGGCRRTGYSPEGPKQSTLAGRLQRDQAASQEKHDAPSPSA